MSIDEETQLTQLIRDRSIMMAVLRPPPESSVTEEKAF